MIPVMQTRFGEQGNCFEACIASLLHLKIDDVPDLYAYRDDRLWISKLNNWLAERELNYFEVEVPECETKTFFKDHDFYHIIIAKTEMSKSLQHAVIGRKGKVVHDPYPKSPGILKSKRITMGLIILQCFNQREDYV